jgi:hypothetical protein
MKTKLLLAIFSIISAGMPTISIAQTPAFNNVQEHINGIPVYRQIGCFIAPETVDGLIGTSDLIVIAKIKQSIEEAKPVPQFANDGAIITTISKVQGEIGKVFKGNLNLKGQSITIGQQAAMLTDKSKKRYISTMEDYQPFKKVSYLLFLKKGLDGKTYFPVGVYYGKYNIDGTDNSEDAIRDDKFITIRKAIKQRFKASST